MKKVKTTMHYDRDTEQIYVIDAQSMFDAFNFAFGKITKKKIRVEIRGYKNKIIIKKGK